MYHLYSLLTGDAPDSQARQWMDDMVRQQGGGDEARTQIARVMHRWPASGAGKQLLGWTKHQLRKETALR